MEQRLEDQTGKRVATSHQSPHRGLPCVLIVNEVHESTRLYLQPHGTVATTADVAAGCSCLV